MRVLGGDCSVSCTVFDESVLVSLSRFEGIGTVLLVTEDSSGGPRVSSKLGSAGDEAWALVTARQLYDVCMGKNLLLTLAVKDVDRALLLEVVEYVKEELGKAC